jgi:hypothetical protein
MFSVYGQRAQHAPSKTYGVETMNNKQQCSARTHSIIAEHMTWAQRTLPSSGEVAPHHSCQHGKSKPPLLLATF